VSFKNLLISAVFLGPLQTTEVESVSISEPTDMILTSLCEDLKYNRFPAMENKIRLTYRWLSIHLISIGN
jgi:hypothetical protein